MRKSPEPSVTAGSRQRSRSLERRCLMSAGVVMGTTGPIISEFLAVNDSGLRDEDGDPVTAVQASYADFVWGLPPQADPLYPSLGLFAGAIEHADSQRAATAVDVALPVDGQSIGVAAITEIDEDAAVRRPPFRREIVGQDVVRRIVGRGDVQRPLIR